MSTATSIKQAKRCDTWIVDEYGPRCRKLDEIVYLRNDVVTERMSPAGKYDKIVLMFGDGPEGHHRLDMHVTQWPATKKPALSGLGVLDRAFAAALIVLATIGAFVTVAGVASALN